MSRPVSGEVSAKPAGAYVWTNVELTDGEEEWAFRILASVACALTGAAAAADGASAGFAGRASKVRRQSKTAATNNLRCAVRMLGGVFTFYENLSLFFSQCLKCRRPVNTI